MFEVSFAPVFVVGKILCVHALQCFTSSMQDPDCGNTHFRTGKKVYNHLMWMVIGEDKYWILVHLHWYLSGSTAVVGG